MTEKIVDLDLKPQNKLTNKPLIPAGLQKGDKVAIYMPMIVEIVVAMLACARLGVIHSIVVSAALDNLY